MRGTHPPTAPRRTEAETRPAKTTAGLAAGVAAAVAIPLALLALAHPAAVTVGAVAGGGLAAVVRRE